MAGAIATVLICDDEPALRELIRVSLHGAYEFVECDDGEACLALARERRPDVVVLDVMMPLRNGLDVLADLRQDDELMDTKVIVLTAQPTTRDEAVRAGADVVMVKPFAPDDINAAVEEVLGRQT